MSSAFHEHQDLKLKQDCKKHFLACQEQRTNLFWEMVVAVEICQQLSEFLFYWEKLCPESTKENYQRIKMCIFVMIYHKCQKLVMLLVYINYLIYLVSLVSVYVYCSQRYMALKCLKLLILKTFWGKISPIILVHQTSSSMKR